ncbi:MAG: 1-acyl-sn-glycerol-3-phosphate acyltransferase [Deltaproteobacteria bacterium]|nr:1-acyl-sn-glycerol-3-phosphate acyltransferase [Deltaproteobacteria bacterium]
MLGKLNLARKWRVVMTGVCFLTFLCGGLILTVTALPLILLLSATPAQRERRTLLLIHYAFKFFMRYMQMLNPISSFQVHGLEHVSSRKGALFIANHPTLIDVVAIMSSLPNCQCIVKKSLLQNVYFGRLLQAAGYVAHDSSEFMAECAQRLHAGFSLLIFPEGTRSPLEGLQRFSRGAAQIALRTGAAVVPVAVTCEPPTLHKGDPWYTVPSRPIDLTLRFFPSLEIPTAVTEKKHLPLQARALTSYWENFFRQELHMAKSSALDPSEENISEAAGTPLPIGGPLQ